MRPRKADDVRSSGGGGYWSWVWEWWGSGSEVGGGWGGGRASWGTSDKVLFVANENDPRWTAQSDERVQRLVRESVGFRRVFSALSASRRTMVVHNGLYDLMFLIDKFHVPLPPSLERFKQLVPI